MVSTSYPRNSEDWQGRFIADMATALGGKQDLQMDLWAPPGELPNRVAYAATSEEAAWLAGMMRHGGIAQILRKRGPFALGTAWGLLSRLRRLYRRTAADVLHVNWLQNALPLSVSNKPVLITVLGSDFGLLKLPGMVAALRRALHGRRAILAPNAGWMAAKLESHFGDLARIRSIPFGIDPAWLAVERTAFSASPCHWLAVTRLTSGKLGTLFEWGELVFGKEHVLHLFGPRQETGIAIPDWVQYHGPTHPAVLRDEWFPRAAGLITLSRHDEGRPQVLLEAMAAGLPVIASALPAHDEIIRHGETGMLIDTPQSLAVALEFLGNPATNHATGLAAREWIRAHVGTWQDCADRYAAAYLELTGMGA